MRSRLQDALHGESVSKYLIGKQKEISSKKIITTLTNENGIVLKDHKDIQEFVTGFFRTLYSKANCNIEKQNNFLTYIRNELSDNDRSMLTSPITKQE